MDTNNLVERIDVIRTHVQREGSNAEIFDWLSDCQVYLENQHKGHEYTKQFIIEKENFKSAIISFQSYSLDSFDSLASTIRAVKKSEDAKSEGIKRMSQTISNGNRRNDFPNRTSF